MREQAPADAARRRIKNASFERGHAQVLRFDRSLLDGVDPEIEQRALQPVRRVIEPRSDDEGVRLDAAVWLVQATA
ncbi:MAG: hypothetical protein WAM97_01300 [Acidimicrobiales bacterium]